MLGAHASVATILVADIDARVRDIVRDMLEPDGHRVVSAVDSQHALDLALELRPDLAIIDVFMPPAGSIEILRTIKTTAGTIEVPVIIISGSGALDEED